MTAVLNAADVDFLEEEVREFEQASGETLEDGEVPEAYDCQGSCWGGCTEQVAKNPQGPA